MLDMLVDRPRATLGIRLVGGIDFASMDGRGTYGDCGRGESVTAAVLAATRRVYRMYVGFLIGHRGSLGNHAGERLDGERLRAGSFEFDRGWFPR